MFHILMGKGAQIAAQALILQAARPCSIRHWYRLGIGHQQWYRLLYTQNVRIISSFAAQHQLC